MARVRDSFDPRQAVEASRWNGTITADHHNDWSGFESGPPATSAQNRLSRPLLHGRLAVPRTRHPTRPQATPVWRLRWYGTGNATGWARGTNGRAVRPAVAA